MLVKKQQLEPDMKQNTASKLGKVPGGSKVKNPPARQEPQACGFDPWVKKIPWRGAWQTTPVFLPREFHGQRSPVGCGPWGHRKLDTIESKHTDTDTHRVLPKRTKIQKPTASIMCQTVKVSLKHVIRS